MISPNSKVTSQLGGGMQILINCVRRFLFKKERVIRTHRLASLARPEPLGRTADERGLAMQICRSYLAGPATLIMVVAWVVPPYLSVFT